MRTLPFILALQLAAYVCVPLRLTPEDCSGDQKHGIAVGYVQLNLSTEMCEATPCCPVKERSSETPNQKPCGFIDCMMANCAFIEPSASVLADFSIAPQFEAFPVATVLPPHAKPSWRPPNVV